MYDFKKKKMDDPKIACYQNPYFMRGRADLLQHIKRQTHMSHPKRSQNYLASILPPDTSHLKPKWNI